jgi:hypothetical protein
MTDKRFKIRWNDLGCPTEPGNYEYQGNLVKVTRGNIEAAGGNPDAICTLICFTPISGPSSWVLGSIDSDPQR